MIYNIFSNNSSPIGISAKALVKDKVHNFYFDSSFVKEKFKKSQHSRRVTSAGREKN